MRVALLLGLALATSLAHATRASAQLPALRARQVVAGLSQPLGLVQDPLDSDVQFVVQKLGLIRVLVNGVLQPTPFLDLSAEVNPAPSERGLLGLAFPPDHADSRRVYVSFTNSAGDSVVARVLRSTVNPLVADRATLVPFRWGSATGPTSIDQPADNHNGGHIVFGPDGYLYLGLGDGGGGNDPNNNAQSASTLLGKMLRLNVDVPDDHAQGYTVPADNPFVDGDPVDALPEIWDFGLRNPWKFSFDDDFDRGGTGALIIGDVGQGQWEELDYEPAGSGGRNYGWRRREGAHDYIQTEPAAYTPLQDPFYEYPHPASRSVTAGFVYRGTLLPPAYRGRFFFADFVSGQVWSMSIPLDGSGEAIPVPTGAAAVVDHTPQLGGLTSGPSSFGLDSRGELYVVAIGGRVVRLQPRQTFGDFNDDGTMDRVVFRPLTGQWFVDSQPTVQFGAFGDVPVPGDYNGDFRTDAAVFRPRTGTWYLRNVATRTWGQETDRPVPADYDGDGRTDVAVWRPSNGVWYVLTSASGFTAAQATAWGTEGDIPVPADYDGDGDADLAVFRPSSGAWYVRGGSVQAWGAANDIPVPADYDGDGDADVAVFRPSTATWFIAGRAPVQFGAPGDEPRPMDIDGDRQFELTIYRPTSGTWAHRNVATGVQATANFGAPGDLAPVGPGIGTVRISVRGDIDGDRLADIAVFRPATGAWLVRGSAAGYGLAPPVAWGAAGDVPVSADYLGAGRDQLAVFRPSTGAWHVRGGLTRLWGLSTDVPAPADYDGDGRTDIAVFRPASGVWYILTSSSHFSSAQAVAWGASGDIPVPGDYDGDGRADLAVFRPESQSWYLRRSRDGVLVATATIGAATPLPRHARDAASLPAGFRTATDDWVTLDGGTTLATLTACGCWQPGTADRDGDGVGDAIGYSAGAWELRSSQGLAPLSLSLGEPGDVPVLPR